MYSCRSWPRRKTEQSLIYMVGDSFVNVWLVNFKVPKCREEQVPVSELSNHSKFGNPISRQQFHYPWNKVDLYIKIPVTNIKNSFQFHISTLDYRWFITFRGNKTWIGTSKHLIITLINTKPSIYQGQEKDIIIFKFPS